MTHTMSSEIEPMIREGAQEEFIILRQDLLTNKISTRVMREGRN